MPYASEAQSRYIHMEAAKGVGWAKKFVADEGCLHPLRGWACIDA